MTDRNAWGQTFSPPPYTDVCCPLCAGRGWVKASALPLPAATTTPEPDPGLRRRLQGPPTIPTPEPEPEPEPTMLEKLDWGGPTMPEAGKDIEWHGPGMIWASEANGPAFAAYAQAKQDWVISRYREDRQIIYVLSFAPLVVPTTNPALNAPHGDTDFFYKFRSFDEAVTRREEICVRAAIHAITGVWP